MSKELDSIKDRLVTIFDAVAKVAEYYAGKDMDQCGRETHQTFAQAATAAAAIAHTVSAIEGQQTAQEDFSASVEALSRAMEMIDGRMGALEDKAGRRPVTPKPRPAGRSGGGVTKI